jgi:hypothetical protein
MPSRARLIATLAVLAALTAAFTEPAPAAPAAPGDDIQALAGDWLYVRDLTEGRAVEDQGPRMNATITLRVEEDAVVWERSGGDEPFMIDGSAIEEAQQGATTRRRGAWKDGLLEYVVETTRDEDGAVLMLIHREFRVTPEGLQVRVVMDDPSKPGSLALYRHPDDIELPAPAPATIADVAWLAGAWAGMRGTSSIEERWGPPRGGVMLGTSSTVKGDRLTAFEFLRIVERDGGLVYVAQPGGVPPTEFVLTELGTTRAVFENPRHDSPQRIVYELSAEGVLIASIGFMKGGRPQRFEFTPEGY